MSSSGRRSVTHVLLCLCVVALNARGTSPELSAPNPADEGLAGGGGRSRSSGYQVWSVLGPGVISGRCKATEYHAEVGLGATLNAGFLNPLDLNFDGAANGKDLFVFPLGWMKYPGQQGYRNGGDLDGDSRIEPDDLLIYRRMTRRQ